MWHVDYFDCGDDDEDDEDYCQEFSGESDDDDDNSMADDDDDDDDGDKDHVEMGYGDEPLSDTNDAGDAVVSQQSDDDDDDDIWEDVAGGGDSSVEQERVRASLANDNSDSSSRLSDKNVRPATEDPIERAATSTAAAATEAEAMKLTNAGWAATASAIFQAAAVLRWARNTAKDVGNERAQAALDIYAASGSGEDGGGINSKEELLEWVKTCGIGAKEARVLANGWLAMEKLHLLRAWVKDYMAAFQKASNGCDMRPFEMSCQSTVVEKESIPMKSRNSKRPEDYVCRVTGKSKNLVKIWFLGLQQQQQPDDADAALSYVVTDSVAMVCRALSCIMQFEKFIKYTHESTSPYTADTRNNNLGKFLRNSIVAVHHAFSVQQ